MTSSSKIGLDRLLYTHYQHNNLASAHKFFTDFGLHTVKQSDTIIYYRGFGQNPCLYVAEQAQGDRKKFVAGAWLVRSEEDFKKASEHKNASPVRESEAPGGGQVVDIEDPNGMLVRLLYGVQLREKESQQKEEPAPVIFNTWEDKPRKGEFQRFDGGPSKVHKLGHFGLVVDPSKFDSTTAWYLENFTLAPTDSLYNKDTGKDTMTFMHIDKGEEYQDHHVSHHHVFRSQGRALSEQPSQHRYRHNRTSKLTPWRYTEFLHPVSTIPRGGKLSSPFELRSRPH